jgi:type II secretory pathway component GspD/PulD (secretin)/tetratricopeptide (TPR) repeat protein
LFHRKPFVVVASATLGVVLWAPLAATQADTPASADHHRAAAARKLLDEATADVMANRLDDAQRKLQTVRDSNVELGWFDQERLDRQLKTIDAKRNDPSFVAETSVIASPLAGSALAQADGEVTAPAAQPADDPALDLNGEAAAPAATDNDLFAVTRKIRSQERLAEGRQAEMQGQLQLAASLYGESVRFDPDNADAKAALAAVEAKVARQTAPASVLDSEIDSIALRRAATKAEYDQLMSSARAQLASGNYAGANETANQAKLTLDRNRMVMPKGEYDQLRAAAENLQGQIDVARIEAAQRDRRVAQTTAAADARRSEAMARRERDEQVQRLLRRAADLRREQKYDQSLELVNQALFIEPTNIAAQAMRDMIEDTALIVDYRRIDDNLNLERRRLMNQTHEALTPYSEILVYPKEWPKITATRLADLDTMGGDSEVNRRVANRLREPVPINFEANKLVNVIDYLRNTTGVNFFVNWPVLEAAGIEKDYPITLQLSNVPAEQALRLVLQQASAANEFDPVGFSIIEGIVTISTQRDLTKTTDTRVYDIRDLLVQVPNFSNAPEFDLNESLSNTTSGGSNQGGQGGTGGGGGGSLFGDSAQEQETGPTRAEIIEQVVSLIQDTVGRPEEWAALGGDVSSLRELNGNLIIKTTPQNHREVMALLSQLRETRAIQIAVEARFLLVDQNFLNEVGLDIDIQVNNLGGNFGPLTIAQDSIGLAGSPGSTGLPGSFGSRETGLPGSFTPGLGFNPTGRSLDIGISYLDDIEVNLLLNATQASRQSMSLTAPRVTFFNGQRAFVIVARQISFISDLEPIPDALGFDPTLSVTNSGVVLDVEGTISADRRYVTMTVRPSLATVTTPIRSITVFGAAQLGNNNNNAQVIPLQGFIEAPELELTSVRTTVSVPDRGTLLLGGQRLAADVEVEAGVPVLSKIPYLNRLFTNSSTIKDERTLLILIRPTIIIQSEEEELHFPGLNQDPQRYGIGSRVQ